VIAVVDYGIGNVRSVLNAIEYIGEDGIITSSKNEIDDASHIILPGVGSFGNGIERLRKTGLDEVLHEQVFSKGKHVLGICLGLQLLTKKSEEHGLHQGLGWFEAEIKKFDFADNALKIPHVGWNEVSLDPHHPIFSGLDSMKSTFYFVHSYHVVCDDPNVVIATSNYGYTFPVALAYDNLVATQFHPEKSQDNGIHFLENFFAWKS